MRYPVRALVCGILGLVILASTPPSFADPPSAITINVDASADRHAISPLIYGVSYGSDYNALADLGATLNRNGATPASTYNWQVNADNRAGDFFFESIALDSAVPGELGDTFIQASKSGGALPMLTIPMLDWVAKVGPGRATLCSFSVPKYGPQTDADPDHPDCGNGIVNDGPPPTFVANDPNDAYVPSSVNFQKGWIQHIVDKWHPAASGGLRYYLMDNESSIWWQWHRDVAPTGAHDTEIRDKIVAYATAVKQVDPTALVVGPEEWGWDGYFFSGFDQQNFAGACCADHDAHGDYLAYLLDQLRAHDLSTGKRLLDVFSVHYYPQGIDGTGTVEFTDGVNDDVSADAQLLRNKSTRSLWDPNYVDVSWIASTVKLIPRIKELVATHYPGTVAAITEYNWGAEGHINGATAQADILGIFGREGLEMGVRWLTPSIGTPVYNAFKMYRNYDGNHSGFGETSVRASVVNANLDDVAAFAALRASDGALTVMVVGKFRTPGSTQVTINLANFGGQTARVYQLTNPGNAITPPTDIPVSGNALVATIPAQSTTLFVIAPSNPSLTLGLNRTSFGHGDSLVLTGTLIPGSNPTPVDAYVVLRVPGGGFLSLTLTGGVVPGLVPIATGFTPFSFTGTLFQHQMTGGEPQGPFAFLAGLTQTGTLNVIGTIDEKDFTIGP
jgi:hypothetical protein